MTFYQIKNNIQSLTNFINDDDDLDSAIEIVDEIIWDLSDYQDRQPSSIEDQLKNEVLDEFFASVNHLTYIEFHEMINEMLSKYGTNNNNNTGT
jgi:hypothetical protein